MAEIVRPDWMTAEQYVVWQDLYLEAGGGGVVGSEDRATELFRQLPEYKQWFPGILREDGSNRYASNPEQTYYSNMASFRQTVENTGINPDVFEQEYVDLISGDTSPTEFKQRTNAFQQRVLDGGDLTRNWYAQNLGLVPTNPALLASLMSSRMNDAILNKEITMAEIGGQAALRDFDISSQFSEQLQQQGMDRQTADRFFGTAERMVPVLNALAARHGDPDDDFSLDEFAQAEFFDNAAQASRLDRLKAQEDASFTGNKQTDYALSGKTGGVSGLDVL